MVMLVPTVDPQWQLTQMSPIPSPSPQACSKLSSRVP